jgi:hypothetical protein
MKNFSLVLFGLGLFITQSLTPNLTFANRSRRPIIPPPHTQFDAGARNLIQYIEDDGSDANLVALLLNDGLIDKKLVMDDALFAAVRHNRVPVAKLLLDLGVDPSADPLLSNFSHHYYLKFTSGESTSIISQIVSNNRDEILRHVMKIKPDLLIELAHQLLRPVQAHQVLQPAPTAPPADEDQRIFEIIKKIVLLGGNLNQVDRTPGSRFPGYTFFMQLIEFANTSRLNQSRVAELLRLYPTTIDLTYIADDGMSALRLIRTYSLDDLQRLVAKLKSIYDQRLQEIPSTDLGPNLIPIVSDYLL